MMLIEVFTPRGALTGERRLEAGERLLTEVTAHDGTPPEILEAARSLWHVVFVEPDAWMNGVGALSPDEPPRFFVRVTLPSDGTSITHEVRADYVARITRALALTGDDRERFQREPHVAVHIVEIPEGSFGTLGRAMSTADIVKLATAAAGTPRPATPVEPGADTATDPVCGMTVALDDTAILLTRHGRTYAFCGDPCRQVFAEQLAARSGPTH